jgi:hypothetical protein
LSLKQRQTNRFKPHNLRYSSLACIEAVCPTAVDAVRLLQPKYQVIWSVWGGRHGRYLSVN